jgi:hypothetical protein
MSVMARVVDGELAPLEKTQVDWERGKAAVPLKEAAERLEMAGRPDLARGVRVILARFLEGR